MPIGGACVFGSGIMKRREVYDMDSGSLRISVIVPVYNTEKYLRRCIDSILNQTYEALEVILVDDGSTDGSGAVCDEYAEKDARVRAIHQKNGGISAARNAGIDAASGQYIAFIDSDDYVTGDMLAELLRICREENADAAIGGYYGIGMKGTVRWAVIPRGVAVISGRALLLREDPQIPAGMAWGAIFKAQLWRTVRFPLHQNYEDNWTMPEVYIQCEKVTTLPKGIYYYCEHAASIMHSAPSLEAAEMRLNLFQHLAEFYRLHGMKGLSAKMKSSYLSHFEEYQKSGLAFSAARKNTYKRFFWQFILLPGEGTIRAKAGSVFRRIRG